jgi:succinoglycan biosynthesis transport protein ExoP
MQQEISVSLGDVFRFLRRGFLLALLLAALGATLAYVLSGLREPLYRAETTLLITRGDLSLGAFSAPIIVAPPLDASAYATAAMSSEVIEEALVALGAEAVSQQQVQEVRNRLVALPRESATARDSSQLILQVEGGSAEEAAALANALARSLIEWDLLRAENALAQSITQLDRSIANTQAEIARLQAEGAPPDQIGRLQNRLNNQLANRDEAEANIGTATSRLSVIQAAAPPLRPVSPRPPLDAVIAGFLGFVLGYGILLLRNLLDTRLRSVEDLEAVSGLPILAEFAKSPKKTRRLPREASGYLRTNLLLATPKVHPKVILITSPHHGEGKSSVAISLAESFTRANYRTLLVDADLRKPVIAREYNLDDKRHMPLRTHLENPHGSYEAAHVGVNLAQTLDIIPTFRAAPSPTELLSLGFPSCLESWQQDYDVIVIDSAPLLDVADTLTIAPLCTGTVLVASLQETDPQALTDAVELLQRSGVRIFGIAATFVPHGTGVRARAASHRYTYEAELNDDPLAVAPLPPPASPSQPVKARSRPS